MTNWDDVVNTFGPTVFRIASRIVGNSADAEDLAQTAFMEAYRIRQKESVKNWPALLRRIVTHRAYDLLKTKRRLQTLDLQHDEIADNQEPTGRVVANETVQRLKQAASNLPPQQACAFWLRYFDSCSNDEIAEAMGISSHAVAVALNKARATLAPKFTQSTCGRHE